MGTELYNCRFEVDDAFTKRMNATQDYLLKLLGIKTRQTIEGLIGKPIRYGASSRRRKPKQVFRAWARSDNPDDAPARRVYVSITPTVSNGRRVISAGLVSSSRGGEKWLEAIETGGKFRANDQTTEQRAESIAQGLLKKRYIQNNRLLSRKGL